MQAIAARAANPDLQRQIYENEPTTKFMALVISSASEETNSKWSSPSSPMQNALQFSTL